MALTLSSTRLVPARNERMLVAAARRGDDGAFEVLYARYRERIAAFIGSRVHDHGRAEDVAQEVFISALRRLRSSDQPIAFKPWIYEIAKNACIDEFRRGTRSREVQLQPDEDLAADSSVMLSAVPTPPAAIENKQRLDDLRGAFGGLSETHHRLLVMREFEGLSYDEIGDRLGMTRQMVESGLFRARRKLTEEYDELASGRRCQQVQGAIEAGSAQTINSLGLRERRRFSRHLAHCQPCRHTARLAGVDEALLKPRSIAAKIAGLLPFPLWRWPWRGGHGSRGAVASGAGSHRLAAVDSLRTAATLADPAGSSLTIGQAAAAAAALVIAGAGGLVSGSGAHRGLRPHETAVLTASGVPRGSAPATSPVLIPPAIAAPAKRSISAGHSARPATPGGLRRSRNRVAGHATRSSTARRAGTVTPTSPATISGSTGPGARSSIPGIAAPVKTAGVTGAVGSTVSAAKRAVAGPGPVLLSAPVRKVQSAVNGAVGPVHVPAAPLPPAQSTGVPSTVSGLAGPLKSGTGSILP